MNYIDSKALEVKKQIENDIVVLTVKSLDNFFTKSLDSRTISFTKYYNKTVLDKEIINFGEFKQQWAIQGMKRYISRF